MTYPSLNDLRPRYPHWEKTKDLIDQLIDITLNHRQSGHPGGSRSKVPAMVVTMLSGMMKYDLRAPGKTLGDRFVLVAGHTCPMVYATLALLNAALAERHKRTGDDRFLVPGGDERVLVPSDLLDLRRKGGLPGHAEMEGKTLFFKANTGPSGHGSPAAAGQAMALRAAGNPDVKVFAFEGEGGMTTGATHETKNSAWGLGLGNLVYVLDWNDCGIDDTRISEVVYGTPDDWFRSAGWRVSGAEDGEDWEQITKAFSEVIDVPAAETRPGIVWVKNRKGRGYLVYDNLSHGKAHAKNSDIFWETKRPFAEKYNVEFDGFGKPAPESAEAFREQTRINIEKVIDVMRSDEALLNDITDSLVSVGDSVPEPPQTIRVDGQRNPLKDPMVVDATRYPDEVFAKPGDKQPNRVGLGKAGAYLNSYMKKEYGRPLVLACAADLADSTNISGFSKPFLENENFGLYNRDKNLTGSLLPQEITEFTNSGIVCGLASVNFAKDNEKEWIGYVGACATYGSFSYLKYGPMRLFSQIAQDSQIKVGKVIWIAGHSGPETAEDSRTHFGIFAPGVTQLFPEGSVLNLHPWEHNEVPVVLAAGLKHSKASVLALHLTRPAVQIPDREALGIPSHFEAARGAYVMKPFDSSKPKQGTIIVQGTSTVDGLVSLIPELKKSGPNVKIVAAISPELFKEQPQSYRDEVLPMSEWMNSMCITNGARRLMHDWLPHKIAEEYTISSDWDDRWRTGGSVPEVLEEAHIDAGWIMKGIERFVGDQEVRMKRLRSALDGVNGAAS